MTSDRRTPGFCIAWGIHYNAGLGICAWSLGQRIEGLWHAKYKHDAQASGSFHTLGLTRLRVVLVFVNALGVCCGAIDADNTVFPAFEMKDCYET
jgi:hypothetical protein